MENVRGMLPYAEQIKEDFKNIRIKNKKFISYDLDYKLLFSDQFGVAQRNQDLFFLLLEMIFLI